MADQWLQVPTCFRSAVGVLGGSDLAVDPPGGRSHALQVARLHSDQIVFFNCLDLCHKSLDFGEHQ